MKRKTLVYIAPHLSTGGLPQYLFKQIESMVNDFDVYCIEWDNVTGGVLVVQRNRIQNILGGRLITLGADKRDIFPLLAKLTPDVVHLQEIPELFMPRSIADDIYAPSRTYTIIETSHDSSFDVRAKVYFPDKFLMVSKYQINQYRTLGIPCDLVEYPIEPKLRTKTRDEALLALGLDPTKKHVINVGLFTPRKNQAEIIEYARQLQHYPIQFHFIGNQADNFKSYWEPLMQNFPKNCNWWNERSDIDSFYEAADLFLFTSRGNNHDKETMPLVIREALSWKTPSLIYNLPVYLNYFDKFDTISYLTESSERNIELILHAVGLSSSEEMFFTPDGPQRLAELDYPNSADETAKKYGDAASQYYATFIKKELENSTVTINRGDVFVDLGANIGITAKYAELRGAEIHCFEPDPHMVQLLRRNVPSAMVYSYAIAPTPTQVTLHHWPHNHVVGGPTYTTDAISLRNVLDLVGKPIDYLKIDIEGYEDQLFDGLTNKECGKIHKMVIEHHNHDTLPNFLDKLKARGFDIVFVRHGYQSFIYAQHTQFNKNIMTQPIENFGITSRWDLNTQTMYYSCKQPIEFPIIVTIREYKSDAVLWAVESDRLDANCESWIIPIHKESFSYADDPYFTGVKLCMYRKDTGEQFYEQPFFHKFVNTPTLTLSNFLPYRFNYIEFFVEKKYGKWIDKPHKLVVDVGANAGVFTEHMLRNKFAQRIVAVECDSTALKDLQRNFEHNSRVTIIPRALSSTTDPITFYEFTKNPLISTILSPDQIKKHGSGLVSDRTTTVETVTLSQIIREHGIIDLLKIDIEGAEFDIILNAPDELFTYIRSLFIECHFMESTARAKYDMMLEKFARLGYRVEEEISADALEKAARVSESIYVYTP